ncbi:MAG: transglycosylase domain-containing protein [Candidatus Paceibacterota bacterium]
MTTTTLIIYLSLISLPALISLLHPSVTLSMQNSGSSRILDDNLEVIAVVHNPETLYRYEKRAPEQLIKLIVFQEDKKFYTHKGFDLEGTTRALYNNLRGNSIQGGSTITQQLVRNRTAIGSARSYSRKVKEALAAIEIETSMSKNEIMKEYINSVYMGNGIRGLNTASRVWFKKDLTALSTIEQAVLVSTIPCPSSCNPVDNPKTSKKRSEHLVKTAFTNKIIQSSTTPVLTFPNISRETPSKKQTGDPWVIDTVRREMQRLSILELNDNSWPGGYDILTTINRSMQNSLASSVLEVMGQSERKSKGLEVGSAFIENKTGEIKSIIGSRDFAKSQVNSALGIDGGGTGRQIGSTAKILTVLAAHEKGITREHTLNAPASVMIGGKPVRNYDGNDWGVIDMQTALTWSVNTYFTELAKEVSPNSISAMARKLGLNFPSYNADERVTLGVTESSPLDLASAYAAIASDGVWVSPHIVRKVLYKDALVYEATPERRQAVSATTSSKAQSLLRSVVNFGTGYRAQLNISNTKIDAIGKTGTTDNGADLWFVGSTSAVTGAIWIGNPLANTFINSVPGYPHSGSGAPAEIWRRTLISQNQKTPNFKAETLPYPNKPNFTTGNDDEVRNQLDLTSSEEYPLLEETEPPTSKPLSPKEEPHNLTPSPSPTTKENQNPEDQPIPLTPSPSPSPSQ